ncbi:hypothetical protein V8F20_000456 [Naviculisporaceae sp. PSN 640]
MLGGNNMSRCCRHVHLTTSTSTITNRAASNWSALGKRRVLSTVALGARISILDLHSRTRQTTQLPPLTQWLPSLKSRTAFISTSNKKPPPVKASPSLTGQSPSSPPAVPAAAGNTKTDDGKEASTGPKYAYPERLIIYHSGTGKIIFLATLKLTTIFAFVLFDLWALPTFIAGAASIPQSIGIALCGLIPVTFVAYTTAPFVSTIHMHLPQFARVSAQNLERFAKGVPPTTRLDISTLSFIAKPRTSSLTVGDLKPLVAKDGKKSWRRLGMVNFTRDVSELNANRKWWRFRAVGEFGIQVGGGKKDVKGGGKDKVKLTANEKKLPKSGWVWNVVEEVIRRRAGLGGAAEHLKAAAGRGKK